MARAMSSFPVPLSPRMMAVASVLATCSTSSITLHIAGLSPTWTAGSFIERSIASSRERVGSGKVVLGFTATPERLDGKGMAPTFDALVHGPETSELIERGYLADYRFYAAPIAPNLNGLKKTAGDYNAKAAALVMDRPRLWLVQLLPT